MNTHLDDGQLRAALDGELNKNELAHLVDCAICRSRQEELESQLQFASDKLAFLASATKESRLSSAQAWSRFKKHKLTQKETSMFRKLFSAPLVRYGVPALLVFALVFAFPATRALAGELLNLFRVQRVTVVQVDFTGLEQLDDQAGPDISQLISESVTINDEPDEAVTVATVDEASQLAGFNVRTPQNLTPSRISVMDGASFSLTIDRDKAQALLDEAGRGDLVLPKEVDGADVSITIPSSVSIAYGTCPEPSTENETAREIERETETTATRAELYADCIILAQIPSPEVSAPASLDLAKLAQIGFEFTGMSPEEAAEFVNTVDWTSTLVVPIPQNATSQQQVAVDGVTGALIERTVEDGDDAPRFLLFWVKDGIIYTIGGLGNQADAQTALEIANSLP
jgi:hypothetical protein